MRLSLLDSLQTPPGRHGLLKRASRLSRCFFLTILIIDIFVGFRPSKIQMALCLKTRNFNFGDPTTGRTPSSWSGLQEKVLRDPLNILAATRREIDDGGREGSRRPLNRPSLAERLPGRFWCVHFCQACLPSYQSLRRSQIPVRSRPQKVAISSCAPPEMLKTNPAPPHPARQFLRTCTHTHARLLLNAPQGEYWGRQWMIC